MRYCLFDNCVFLSLVTKNTYVFFLCFSGTSAASTIRDPETSELVAEALLDFLPTSLSKALGPDDTVIGPGVQGFPIVITPDEDIFGGNTVIGPGYNLSAGSTPILELIVPEDSNGTRNFNEFNDVVARMDNGESGSVLFTRTRNGKEEKVFLAFAPVNVRVLRPLDHRYFAAGTNMSTNLIYGLAVGIAERFVPLLSMCLQGRAPLNLKLIRPASPLPLCTAIFFSDIRPLKRQWEGKYLFRQPLALHPWL